MYDEAPDVGLADAHRVQEGGAVAIAGRQEQPRELVHRDRRYWGNSAILPVDYQV